VTDLLTPVKGSGGGGGGGYLGGLGGASGDQSAPMCSASGGGGGSGSSWVAAGTLATDTSRPAGLLDGRATVSWTDPTPVATLTTSSVNLAAGDTLNLAAAVSLLPTVNSPMAVFFNGSTVLGQVPLASNGSAMLPVANLAPGLHQLSVSIIAGNVAYATSPSVAVTVNAAVVPPAPTGTANPSASPSVARSPEPAAANLAQTGPSGPLVILGASALLLMVGGTVLALRRRAI